jgi:F0F1-type ATP synthase assembly protein I
VSRKKRNLQRARVWLDVSIVGIQFPVSIAIGFFFGRWLDGLFHTQPWFTLIFALFGVAAGFLNLFRITAQASRDEAKISAMEAAEKDSEDDAADPR